MTSEYGIDNSQYPKDFHDPVTIPVTEETLRNCRLTPNLKQRLMPGTSFTFTMDQAINTAERHMYIFDSGISSWLTNPVKMVNDWVNLVRWEVSTFWKVYRESGDEIAHTDSRQVHYTHEHPKRSGEVLAEGIALLFLENRMDCPPQCFWFYKGSKARPDFIFDTSFRGIGMMMSGSHFGVEARCRKSQANLYAADEEDLLRKKQSNSNMSYIIGIYLFYGEGHHKRKLKRRTRLHLADPGGEGRPMSDSERAWVIINHYLGVASRLGLWDHRDYLLSCLQDTARGKVPETPLEDVRDLDSADPKVPLDVEQKWRDFVGTDFNTLVEEAKGAELDRLESIAGHKRVQAQLDGGYLGYNVFRGIRKSVLRMIERGEWRKLEEYRDKNAGLHKKGIRIGADGVLQQQVLLTDYTTPHAQRILGQLKELGYRLRG